MEARVNSETCVFGGGHPATLKDSPGEHLNLENGQGGTTCWEVWVNGPRHGCGPGVTYLASVVAANKTTALPVLAEHRTRPGPQMKYLIQFVNSARSLSSKKPGDLPRVT